MQTSASFGKHNGILVVNDKRVEFYEFGSPICSIKINTVFSVTFDPEKKKLLLCQLLSSSPSPSSPSASASDQQEVGSFSGEKGVENHHQRNNDAVAISSSSNYNNNDTDHHHHLSNKLFEFDHVGRGFWEHCIWPVFVEKNRFQAGNSTASTDDEEDVNARNCYSLLATRSSDSWVDLGDAANHPMMRGLQPESTSESTKRNIVQKLDEVRWNVLEGLSKFSKVIRHAAGEFKGYGVIHRPWENPAFKPVVVEETDDGYSRIGYDHAERPKLFQRVIIDERDCLFLFYFTLQYSTLPFHTS